jgi:hypothetical protein
MDFHTDVNWLDKIAYGNNYLNGNYRVDGVGNHHMDPIRNSLDTLYRMYGDCDLVESKELADHIIKVSALMEGVIQAYAEFHIENWEMVRDILAVLGEIMTRCMIKLYNNHMTIFVASDNMDDVDVPGYLYTESFVMEAESTQPSVQVTDQNGDNKQQTIAQKVKMKLSQLFHKFVAWVQNVLSKTPITFFKNHERETTWITKNQKLNQEIAGAIGKTFTATTTNYPHYNIPASALINNPNGVTNYVKSKLDTIKSDNKDNQPTNQKSLKEELYPAKLWQAISGLGTNINTNKERILVNNYVLYGDPNREYIDHNPQSLTKDQFNELIQNLLGTREVLKKVEEIDKDLANALTLCETECKSLENEQTKPEGEEADNKTVNATEKLNAMKALQTELKDVASSYHVAITNLITSKFYPTSYALYRDIVTAYQQQKKSNNLNAIENPKPAENGQAQAATSEVPVAQTEKPVEEE